MKKKVFITGSSSGIGLSIAKKFVNSGEEVVINGRNHKKLKKVAKDIGAAGYICSDFSSDTQAKKGIKNALKILKKFDVLVCNVGSGKSVSPGKESFDEWQKVFKQNFWSTTSAIEHSKNFLTNHSSIICISSICGIEVIDKAPITYSVSKAALNSYIKSMSFVLGKKNIRINGVAPGNIIFEGSVWENKLKKNPKEVKELLLEKVALRKLGKPEDISELVYFLCSKEAEFITGSLFVSDGGQVRSF